MVNKRRVKFASIIIATIALTTCGKQNGSFRPENSTDTLRCKQIIDFALEVAADDELRRRIMTTDPESLFQFIPPIKYDDTYYYLDTAGYITGTVTVSDSAFTLRCKNYDFCAVYKFFQHIYKNTKPVNLNGLAHYFSECMRSNGLIVENPYFELIDIRNNVVLAQNDGFDGKPANCLVSEILTLDQYHTIGIKAYVTIARQTHTSNHFVISSSM